MMFQYGTLIFTGRHTGKMNRGDAREIGIDPDYIFLGSLNRDRTVATTVIDLCRRYSNCTAYEVHETIQFHTRQLIESGKFYREFPDKDQEFEYMSLEDVQRHLKSVLQRSQANCSKFIPHGIERIPGTVYFMYTGRSRQGGKQWDT